MAIYSETRLELVETICRLIGDWWGGTTTGAGTTATLVDTALLFDDDYFNSFTNPMAELYMIDGDAIGQTRQITDFVNSTHTITVAPVFTAATGTGKLYSLHRLWKRADVVDKINLAINMVANEALTYVVDTSTITLVADTYEYDLPTTMIYLNRVTMGDSSNGFDDQDPVPPDQWRIVHASTPMLKFEHLYEAQQADDSYYGEYWALDKLTAARKMRLEGMGAATPLATEAATCPISPAYVVFQAAALLHMQAITQEGDPHAIQYQLLQGRADVERARVVKIKLPPNSKRVLL